MYLTMLREFLAMVRGEPNRTVTVSEAAEVVKFIDDIKARCSPVEKCP